MKLKSIVVVQSNFRQAFGCHSTHCSVTQLHSGLINLRKCNQTIIGPFFFVGTKHAPRFLNRGLDVYYQLNRLMSAKRKLKHI